MFLETTNPQVELMMNLLGSTVNDDRVKCEFYLDNAKDIICEIRHTDSVEPQYKNLQVKIAIELFNKQGIEGQTSHSENGVSRSFQNADVSNALLSQIIPYAKTPTSVRRSIPTPL